jgi:LysM repeat protein
MNTNSENTRVRHLRRKREKEERAAARRRERLVAGKNLQRLPSTLTEEGQWPTGEPPQVKTRGMFWAMLALHVLGVGGIIAFHFMGRDEAKDTARRKAEAAKAAELAQAAKRQPPAAAATPGAVPVAPVASATRKLPEGFRSHIIKLDESWASIAEHNGLSEADLKSANPSAMFAIGLEIFIPPPRNIITPQPDTTTSRIAENKRDSIHYPDNSKAERIRYAVNPEGQAGPPPTAEEARASQPPPQESAATQNSQKPPAKSDARKVTPMGRTVKTTGAGEASVVRYHTVANGETLYSIARKYKSSVGQIQGANAGLNADKLRPGMRLKIP